MTMGWKAATAILIALSKQFQAKISDTTQAEVLAEIEGSREEIARSRKEAVRSRAVVERWLAGAGDPCNQHISGIHQCSFSSSLGPQEMCDT